MFLFPLTTPSPSFFIPLTSLFQKHSIPRMHCLTSKVLDNKFRINIQTDGDERPIHCGYRDEYKPKIFQRKSRPKDTRR